MRSYDEADPDETPLLLADWGHRLIAFLIETVVFFVIFIVVSRAIWPITENLISGDEYHATVGGARGTSFSLLFMILLYTAVIVLIIWGGLLEGIWGLTPGKKMTGLKVVSAKDHNQTIGFARGIAREITRSIPIIPYFLFTLSVFGNLNQLYIALSLVLLLPSVLVFVLDHLWPLWDKERQALHDKIAKSHVVSEETGIIEQVLYNKLNRFYTIRGDSPGGFR